MSLLLQDALLQGSTNLPAAGASAATSLIDLSISPTSEFDPEHVQFQLSSPALTTVQAISGTTVSYTVFNSDAATTNTASAVPVMSLPAGGDSAAPGAFSALNTAANSGIAAFASTFRLSTKARRYVWVQATASASTVATAAVATLAVVF